MKTCPLLANLPPCFVHMGKYGDEMIIMPALREIYRRTGTKPIVIASMPYHTIYEGVSYAYGLGAPWPIDHHGVSLARQFAWHYFGNCVVPKWWDDSQHDSQVVAENEHAMVMSYKGKRLVLDRRQNPTYQIDQWLRTGFTLEEMTSLPLIFDQRNSAREQDLIRTYVHGEKPILLVNWEGQTSPFAMVPEITKAIRHLLKHFQIIDLGQIRAPRIFDLLGLMDIAAGMITVDTATLHLAAASRIPYIALLTQGPHGWGRSTPRGCCVLKLFYEETAKNLDRIVFHVQSFLPVPTRIREELITV